MKASDIKVGARLVWRRGDCVCAVEVVESNARAIRVRPAVSESGLCYHAVPADLYETGEAAMRDVCWWQCP
jgi:hypothetical protein